jgi:uncharacterized protein
MFHSHQDEPLNEAECHRLASMLSQFHSEHAMNNAEEIDGFFAALICSPSMVSPSEYLPEILGGNEPEFTSRDELQDFLGLLFRHWNSIAQVLQKGEVFMPLLLEDQDGIAHANDWARGFMRGTFMRHDNWRELLDDEEQGGALIPMLILAHEHDADEEMQPYKGLVIDSERREALILGIACGVSLAYRYFSSNRRSMTEGETAYQPRRQKIGRNDFCPCGSGKKYKHCCGKIQS